MNVSLNLRVEIGQSVTSTHEHRLFSAPHRSTSSVLLVDNLKAFSDEKLHSNLLTSLDVKYFAMHICSKRSLLT